LFTIADLIGWPLVNLLAAACNH